jgi:hypothetical protein
MPAALLALLLAACGSSGAKTYKTATEVVEALGAGGMTLQCPNADSPAGQTVVHGAISENMCYLGSGNSVSYLIDVFRGTVSKSKLIANSVSAANTGSGPRDSTACTRTPGSA